MKEMEEPRSVRNLQKCMCIFLVFCFASVLFIQIVYFSELAYYEYMGDDEDLIIVMEKFRFKLVYKYNKEVGNLILIPGEENCLYTVITGLFVIK